MNQTSTKFAKAFISGKKTEGANTTVIIKDGEVLMKLFGNIIARRMCRKDDVICLNDCSWQTRTTKDRLNALLSLYSAPVYIVQTKGVWILRGYDKKEYEWKYHGDNIIQLK